MIEKIDCGSRIKLISYLFLCKDVPPSIMKFDGC